MSPDVLLPFLEALVSLGELFAIDLFTESLMVSSLSKKILAIGKYIEHGYKAPIHAFHT